MEDIVLISISKKELETIIENSVRKILNQNVIDQNNQGLPELLSVKEAAAFLKISPPTIYGYTHLRTIPHCKKGKRLYFPKEDLIKWIKEGKIKTNSEIEMEAATYLVSRSQKNRRKF